MTQNYASLFPICYLKIKKVLQSFDIQTITGLLSVARRGTKLDTLNPLKT